MAKQMLFSIPYNGDLDLIRWAVSTGQVREVYFSGCGTNDYSRRNEKEIKISIKELKEFIIWMTGCGYDFCQHEYFVNERERLLKDK